MKLLLNARPTTTSTTTLLIVGVPYLISGVVGHYENYGSRRSYSQDSCNKLDCSTICLGSTCVSPFLLWLIFMGLFFLIMFGMLGTCYYCRQLCIRRNNGSDGAGAVPYHNYDQKKTPPPAQPAMMMMARNTNVTAISLEEPPKSSNRRPSEAVPPPSYLDCVCAANVKRETGRVDLPNCR